jgi:hypothetical protein
MAIETIKSLTRAAREQRLWSTAESLDSDVDLEAGTEPLWEDAEQGGERIQSEAVVATLAEMRLDRTAHLTPTLLKCLAADERVEEIGGVIIPHLGTCTWCAGMLRETLRLTGVSEDSLAYAVLEDAEEWGRWNAAGRASAASACRTLIEAGIGYVYGKDGTVYRRQPDGQEVLLHSREELLQGQNAIGQGEVSTLNTESTDL